MIGVVALGHEPGGRELVERLLLEADRERAHALGALARGKRGQRGGVDPAREQYPDRHVRDEMGADRVPEPIKKLGGKEVIALAANVAGGGRARARVVAQLRLPAVPDQHLPRAQLARLVEDRQRPGNRVEGEERLERVKVDPPREAGLGQQRL